jgi:tartrate-resistant acid phosphatase type 5
MGDIKRFRVFCNPHRPCLSARTFVNSRFLGLALLLIFVSGCRERETGNTPKRSPHLTSEESVETDDRTQLHRSPKTLDTIHEATLSEDSDESIHTPAKPPTIPQGMDSRKSLQVVAFGDFGFVNQDLKRTMDMYHSKFPSPDMVFLLGDNTYTDISKTSDYPIWFDYVARKSKAPHYVILGNHEYIHQVDQFMLKEMTAADPRWIMPSRYYFKRFEGADFTLCVWFIDTEKFTSDQRTWLDQSLSREKSGCTWKVVSGHHPGMIQASGPSFGRDRPIEPILEKHGVDIYMCGHHHNSQLLTNKPHKTHVFIVGQVSLRHPFGGSPTKGQILWGTDVEPAILELKFDASQIRYNFVGGRTGSSLHSGSILH